MEAFPDRGAGTPSQQSCGGETNNILTEAWLWEPLRGDLPWQDLCHTQELQTGSACRPVL